MNTIVVYNMLTRSLSNIFSFSNKFKKDAIVSQHYFTTTANLLRKNYRSPKKFTKMSSNPQSLFEEGMQDDENYEEKNNDANDTNDTAYQQLVDRAFRVPQMGHNVLVIQPYVKWGSNKKRNTTPELQLEEAVSLIRTLNNWTVADKFTIPLMSLDKSTVFGKGNLEKVQEMVFANKAISAVFVSLDILKGVQKGFLENYFKVPVYDRYTIVLQIFKEHAVSREAKLQLKLAEIPYLRSQVKYLKSNDHFSGSSGETFTEFQHNILEQSEKKLKREIETLRSQRDLLRRKRRRNQMIVIAVVGYTNAGKTSLIKALTGEENLMPKNALFATLDVTVHAGFLPSGLKVLYIDTIGFISDIPTTLLESFVATLEDALLADIIVHVRDCSHPDSRSQCDLVKETLLQLNLGNDMMNNIVEVGNKVDLVSKLKPEEWTNAHLVSAVKLQGLDELKSSIEEAVFRVSGLKQIDIRVSNGGEEYQWLNKEATVYSVRADDTNPQYCFMSVIIAPHVLAKFKHNFIISKKN